MSEMAQTADQLIIIGRGRLLADTPTEQLTKSNARADVLVRSPQAGELASLLSASGATVTRQNDGGLAVTSLDPAAIADLAAQHGIAVHELMPRQPSLEQAYLDLTEASTDYRAGVLAGTSEAT
jgi:ABC-2 type transport system ATP-binding protein